MLTESILLMKNELLITLVLFIVLFSKIASRDGADTETQNDRLMAAVNGMLVVIFALGFFMNTEGSLFGDMFMTSPLKALEKNILLLGTIVVSFTNAAWIRRHKHAPEFYMLLLSTLLGMDLMISSGNLLMFYLGLELSTIPLAALANFDLDKRRSSEAAMKMIMMSAFASCLLLLGISFVYGTSGTISLQVLSVTFGNAPLHVFALVLLMAGFGFKISAAPFHLWTADVYEGAPSGVTAYLSVVSKGAVLFVMISVLYNTFRMMEDVWYQMLFILAVATMVIGNLFALRQTNIKRMLAFSSIAQVGFILTGMSGANDVGQTSVIYFVLVYLFSNLGAFGVISVVSAATGRELISDYNGFYKTNPFLTWVMAISLFSLAGIPPAAGFFAKFFLLMAGSLQQNYPLLIIASLNMVVALFYYLMVIKAMFTGSEENAIPAQQPGFFSTAGLVVCLAGVIASGVYGGVFEYIRNLVQ